MEETLVLERLFRDGEDYYRIRIHEDQFPTSPREGDNPTLLLTWESAYVSPDGRDRMPPALTRALGRWKVSNDYLRPIRAHPIIRYLRAFAADEVFAAAALNRSLDGLELSLDFDPAPDQWYDGLALVPADRWRACMGDTPPETGEEVETLYGMRHVPSAREVLPGDIEVYNAYLRGEVYDYVVDRAVLGGWELVASCSDLMGDVEHYVLDEARAELPESAIEVDALPAEQGPWVGGSALVGPDSGAQAMRAALARAEAAAAGDSNDDELAELRAALDIALSRWPEVAPT